MDEQNSKCEEEEFDIGAWCQRVIEGVGGMNDFERYELGVWNESDRVAAARWVLRSLANPRCEGSRDVLDAIEERRRYLDPRTP